VSELNDYQMPKSYGTTIGKCLTFAEIEGLLAAERERCAAVADMWAEEWAGAARGAARRVGKSIHNLPPQTEGGSHDHNELRS